MMTNPAMKDSWALCAWIHCPSTEAPAPSPTNTVVNPSTKKMDASTTRRQQVRIDATLARHLLDGGAAEIAEVRRHQRQHAWRQKAHEARQRHAEMDVDLGEHALRAR